MRLPEPEGMALVDVGILGVVGVVGVGAAGRNPDSDRCGGDGSDPGVLRVLASHLRAGQSVQQVAHQFRCWDELRCALRSIVRYATDWTGVIYIVTQHGQVPAWMDQSHPGVRIVSLEQLLTEAERRQMLPTFNSNVIESFVHRIPQLSPRFIYVNNDLFFHKPVGLNDF